MKEEKRKIKSELNQVEGLLIDSRQLLSLLQKIQIESERSKRWVLGDLLGSWIFK